MKLILASASPRRKQLLMHFDMAFEVIEADVDESVLPSESPADMTRRLAELKAQTVFSLCDSDCRVLGGDTTVSLGNHILGKPESHDEAVAMLNLLSGKTHSVYSAVAIASDQGIQSLISETQVTFKTLSEAVIAQYCDTQDPYDKAGAYGIQSGASEFVIDLDGSYSGVIGLPLWHTHQLLMGLAS